MKTKTKKSILAAVALSAPLVLLAAAAFTNKISTINYRVQTKKVIKPVRIVLIADLHGFIFGDNQCEVIEAVKKQNPDLVMMAGDIFAEYKSYDGPNILIRGLADLYPCYFVAGNHEFLGDDVDDIKKFVRGCGVEVLEGNYIEATVKGQKIMVYGLEDFKIGEEEFRDQLISLAQVDTKKLSILIAHHTELVNEFKKMKFDLILTGHAHGGQWRIPYILNGFYAPGQGLFPEYAGGLFKYNNTVQVVSRGLCKSEFVPRFFNPPELVVIDIIPE